MNDQFSASSFTPVRITTIKPERTVSFSVFIHFKEHYLKYIDPGESIAQDKYKKLRHQKITKFYIKDTDEEKYQEFLDNFLQKALSDPDTPVEEKTEMVMGQSEISLEKLSKDPTSEASFDMTRKAAKNLQKLVFENPEALNNMFGLHRDPNDDIIVRHSINVCILAIKFGKSQKLNDEEIDYLSTAALMHDIGPLQKKEEAIALFMKDKKDLSFQEKNTYYGHCQSMIPILRERPYINAQIIELIEYHQENLQGLGPNKIKKLSQTQEILNLVNTYDKLCITRKLSPSEGVKVMLIDELGNYNLNLINDFKDFLKKENIL